MKRLIAAFGWGAFVMYVLLVWLWEPGYGRLRGTKRMKDLEDPSSMSPAGL